jgi:hypothetical protein
MRILLFCLAICLALAFLFLMMTHWGQRESLEWREMDIYQAELLCREGDLKGSSQCLTRFYDNMIEDRKFDLPSTLLLKQGLRKRAENVEVDLKRQECNLEFQAKIAQETESFLDTTMLGNANEHLLQFPRWGRVIVWNAILKQLDPAYKDLNDSFLATAQDTVITIVYICDHRTTRVGYYSPTKETAYSDSIKLGIVYWPERTSPGCVALEKYPPIIKEIGRGDFSIVADWIKRLPIKGH